MKMHSFIPCICRIQWHGFARIHGLPEHGNMQLLQKIKMHSTFEKGPYNHMI